jgi:hypothetical protein
MIGLRDKKTGAVWWERFGIPLRTAKLYRDAGCVVIGRDWIASLNEWRYHMSFVGEAWPEVGE